MFYATPEGTAQSLDLEALQGASNVYRHYSLCYRQKSGTQNPYPEQNLQKLEATKYPLQISTCNARVSVKLK